jgi:U3 small nucleolar RNA-associated protein 20
MLYGKMQTKTGKDTSGRGLGHMRKNIVLRFLTGCLPHELSVFLDMVFKPFVHFMTGELLTRSAATFVRL